MNKNELREIINNGENSGVEFKRDVEDNRALAKELVAFANLRGGRVLLGVDKNRAVSGLTRVDPGAELLELEHGGGALHVGRHEQHPAALARSCQIVSKILM